MAFMGRYLDDNERRYFEARKDFVSRTNSAFVADNPFVFASRIQITHMLARVELFKKILPISGAVIECGVAYGNGLMLFAHLSALLEPYAINRKIIGFDTFEGFKSLSKHDSETIEGKFKDTSKELLDEAVKLYDKNRPLGHMEKVELVEGDAVKTIPKYVKDHPELTVAMLYLDFDTYKPTLEALKCLLPLVCKGGIVVFDEFNYDKLSGETLAAKEILDIQNIPLKRFTYAPFIAYYEV